MSASRISPIVIREKAFASFTSVNQCLDNLILGFDEYYLENKTNFDNRNISETLAQEYANSISGFWQLNAVEAANLLLLHAWFQFAEWQQENGRRVSRTTIFNQLTAIHLHILHDLGTATWWGLHTYADELLDGRSDGAGMADLHTRLGISNDALETLKSIAEKNVNLVGGNWAKKEGFAEEIVREFAVEHPQFGYIFGQNSMRAEFPLAKSYYSILLNDFKNTPCYGKDCTEKQKTLERLASYLFLLLPCCVPRKNVKDQDNAFETDIIVRNLNPNSSLIGEVFGRYFSAECKNWETNVGVSEVGYFLHRMRIMHTSFGVLFAKTGVTDEGEDERAARQLIRRSFHEDKITCVVLTLRELERLATGDTTFRSLLFELSEVFRFGKP